MVQFRFNNEMKMCASIRQIVVSIALCVGIIGCSGRYFDFPVYSPFSMSEYPNKSVGRFKTALIASQIDDYYRGTDPGPIGVVSFADLNNLGKSSSFGRVLSEQLLSELSMRGYEVVELRHAEWVRFQKREGEFALSRDSGSVRRERLLGGIVTGTYSATPERVYVNARLLNPKDSLILSAASVEMSVTDEIKRMLRHGSLVTTKERIPMTVSQVHTVPYQHQRHLSSSMQMPHAVPRKHTTENQKSGKARAKGGSASAVGTDNALLELFPES